MEALRIKTHLDSDTLHLPQLGGLVGKDVEIIVFEDAPAIEQKASLDDFLALGGALDLDWDAVEQCRSESKV